MKNCINCEYSTLGSHSALIDICDACQCDGDIGITTQGLPEELKDLFGQRRDDY